MSEGTKASYIDDVEVDRSMDALPSADELAETVENARGRGFDVVVVETPEAALDALTSQVPDGASVMTGHSTTLEEVGFMDYLAEADHGWENRYAEVFGIDDDEARADARRQALTADYFFGSVNAIARTGELVAADASGSRVGAYPFAAKNLVLVSGTNKVVPSLEDALTRLEEFAYRLENERAQEVYGQGSVVAKQLIFRNETVPGRTTLVLVEDSLGF